MRSSAKPARTMDFAFACLCGSALLFSSSRTLAEPPAILMYIKEATGECGEHQTGNPWSRTTPSERSVLDPEFVAFRLPASKPACRALLSRLHGPSYSPSVDDNADPCVALERALPTGVARICEALGYTYIGRLPAVSRPCYPRLGALLGAPCAPEVWLRALFAGIVLLASGGFAYLVFRKRRTNRVYSTRPLG